MNTQPQSAMDIVTLGNEGGRTTLSISVAWDEVAADYDDIVAMFSRVRMAGFRAGKAPRSVVEKRFQREIADEFSNRCGRRLANEAVSRQGAEPMGPIEITDMDCGRGKSFRFVAGFTPMPDFELPEPGPFAPGDEGADPRDLISARLLEQVRFEIPHEMIWIELGSEAEDTPGPKSPEWESAAQRVRLMLILKKIARREGIEVDEADVERRIAEKAVEFGTTAPALRAQLEQTGGTRRLRDMLLAESTLDFLIEKSKAAGL
jgi:FKBP-type peptidyl-prolyl cis-trans isomerase (trigger factor)